MKTGMRILSILFALGTVLQTPRMMAVVSGQYPQMSNFNILAASISYGIQVYASYLVCQWMKEDSPNTRYNIATGYYTFIGSMFMMELGTPDGFN